MRFPNYPATGQRLRELMIARGFVKDDGEPDAARFIREKQYDPRNFYPWLKGRTPAGLNLERLIADLATTRSWLLFGEGARDADRRPLPHRRPVAALVAQVAPATMDSGALVGVGRPARRPAPYLYLAERVSQSGRPHKSREREHAVRISAISRATTPWGRAELVHDAA